MDRKKSLDERKRNFLKSVAQSNRRKRPDRGGSEPVTVEPNRPRLGEGGAAAALEFDA